MASILVCCLSLLGLGFVSTNQESVTVTAKDGIFVGYIHNFQTFGQDYASRRFLGIPFAEPPVGDLRFKKPIRKAKLAEQFVATKVKPTCMQIKMPLGGTRNQEVFEGMTESEDCLFLNIYTPNDDTLQISTLPVMIYIHAGGFGVGTPNFFHGDVLSVYGNVIVVTIAYRLNVWGFLSTGDENLPGNYGLWDQHMAIQWVHDNIAAFGGDPGQITLFGTSAGGASVVYQSMFPDNQRLIRRSIAQSGSITCPWAFTSNPLSTAKRIGRLVGCKTDVTTNELADCLKATKSEKFYEVLNTKENHFMEFPMAFVTSVDGEFIPEPPMQLFHGSSEIAHQYRQSMANLDFIIGVVSGEGLMMIIPFAATEDTENYRADRYSLETEHIPKIAKIMFGDDVPDVVRKLIINEYTDWSNRDNSLLSTKAYIDLSSDYVFNIQLMDTAIVHSEHSDKSTYFYLYDAFLSSRFLPAPSWANKPQHLDDMTSLLGYDPNGYLQFLTPYPSVSPEAWELDLSKALMTMWANFARTGNPNQPVDVTSLTNTTWPTFDIGDQQYLNISRTMSETSVGKRLFARATSFWYDLLPTVIEANRNSRMYSKDSVSEDHGHCEKDGGC